VDNKEKITFSKSNKSELFYNVKPYRVAKLLISFSEVIQPVVEMSHVKEQSVIEFMEYMLAAGFEIASIQHPLMEPPPVNDQCYMSFNDKWVPYLTLFCRLADLMGLYFGVNKDGSMVVLSREANVKGVYYVQLKKTCASEDVYEVWLNKGDE
jgi:hypothetical protein